ncbi:hypothetical protein VHEMI03323 [[Torrubiella] hemipterigena]|uniref:Uncharacterized protein n=1 Tax=[Torrubiella] hemipterigena TaxID=1531966 RepID=A0A0A1TAI1_9HYPO|nr:hypothetical protein VHEMI03323 [[Torrubiella] hemipterigena]
MAEPANTPIPASTPRSTSPAPHFSGLSTPLSPTKLSALHISSKPHILHIHIGDSLSQQDECPSYAALGALCDVHAVAVTDKAALLRDLDAKRWGDDIDAVMIEGDLDWDSEVISLLPRTVKAVAGRGDGGSQLSWERRDIAYVRLDGNTGVSGAYDPSRGIKKLVSVLDATRMGTR